MALITIPNTFTAGDTIIAAEHNDNFTEISDEINGNLDNANIKAAAAIVDTKLAQITTAGKVSGAALTSLGAVPAAAGTPPLWSVRSTFGDIGTIIGITIESGGNVTLNKQSAVYAYQNAAAQTVADSVWTKVVLDGELYDNRSNFAANRFTVTDVGYYFIVGQVGYNTDINTKTYYAGIYKDGVLTTQAESGGGGSASGHTQLASVILYASTPTSYFELYAYHTAVALTTLLNSATTTYFCVNKIA